MFSSHCWEKARLLSLCLSLYQGGGRAGPLPCAARGCAPAAEAIPLWLSLPTLHRCFGAKGQGRSKSNSVAVSAGFRGQLRSADIAVPANTSTLPWRSRLPKIPQSTNLTEKCFNWAPKHLSWVQRHRTAAVPYILEMKAAGRSTYEAIDVRSLARTRCATRRKDYHLQSCRSVRVHRSLHQTCFPRSNYHMLHPLSCAVLLKSTMGLNA